MKLSRFREVDEERKSYMQECWRLSRMLKEKGISPNRQISADEQHEVMLESQKRNDALETELKQIKDKLSESEHKRMEAEMKIQSLTKKNDITQIHLQKLKDDLEEAKNNQPASPISKFVVNASNVVNDSKDSEIKELRKSIEIQ